MKIKHKIFAIALSVLLITVDQLTKIWVVSNIKPIGSKVIINGLLNFTYVENTGAGFGLFKDNALLLGIISGIVLVLLLIYVVFARSREIFLNYTIMVIFAGGAGNVIDRFTRKYVVDFIDVTLGPLKNFPVFNFADCCVTIGAIMLAIYILKPQSKRKKNIFD